MSICNLVREEANADRVTYTSSSATTAFAPILVAKLGVLIPMASADASVQNAFYRGGIFAFDIDSAITVANGDLLWYNTATDKVTNTKPAAGYFLGRAVAAGTATAGVVDVEVFKSVGDAQYMQNGVKAEKAVAFSGTLSATGSGTLETIAVTGCLTTDDAIVTVKTDGGGSAFVTFARIDTAGSISVGLSSASGTGTVLAYKVYRTIL